MPLDFHHISLRDLSDRVNNGQLKATTVVRHAYDVIHDLNPLLNAFVDIFDRSIILKEAEEIDARVNNNHYCGPLAGVPVAIKDIEDVSGSITSFGSFLRKNSDPAISDSNGVQRLRRAGAIIIGKTNTSEFAHKATTDSPLWGSTVNPWNTAYTCGGSSGGSAVAIASGMVPLALGSDGGGSLRIPSAACGFSGFKPSTGSIPTGDITPPLCPPLITRGPMALTIDNIIYALNILEDFSAYDLFSYNLSSSSQDLDATLSNQSIRLLWAPTLGFAPLDTAVRRVCESALDRLREVGFNIKSAPDLFHDDPNKHWLNLWSSGLAARLKSNKQDSTYSLVDSSLKQLVSYGESITAVQLQEAFDASHIYNVILTKTLQDVDAIITPSYNGQLPLVGPNQFGVINGKPTQNWTQVAAIFNLTRHPVATVHAGFLPNRLPIGLQICGRSRGDKTLLAIARLIEIELGGPAIYS